MYKIKDVSAKTGLSAHTLRYYEKEGLLPFVARTESGQRLFNDGDLEWLDLIACLKSTGMPIKEIRHFIGLCRDGDKTLAQRLEMFMNHRDVVQGKLELLRGHLSNIERKITYYSKAVAAGSEWELDCSSCLVD